MIACAACSTRLKPNDNSKAPVVAPRTAAGCMLQALTKTAEDSESSRRSQPRFMWVGLAFGTWCKHIPRLQRMVDHHAGASQDTCGWGVGCEAHLPMEPEPMPWPPVVPWPPVMPYWSPPVVPYWSPTPVPPAVPYLSAVPSPDPVYPEPVPRLSRSPPCLCQHHRNPYTLLDAAAP